MFKKVEKRPKDQPDEKFPKPVGFFGRQTPLICQYISIAKKLQNVFLHVTSIGTFISDLLMVVSEILPIQGAPYIQEVGQILGFRGHLLSTGQHKYSGGLRPPSELCKIGCRDGNKFDAGIQFQLST